MTPIQLDPNHSANSFADTTLAQAQLNTRMALEAQVVAVNKARIQDYDTQWKAYVAARDARPDATNLIAPEPVWAEVVYTDERGWPYVGPSSAIKVTAPRTYVPPVKTPSASIFGTQGAGNTPDPFAVALYATVDHGGMKFLRVA